MELSIRKSTQPRDIALLFLIVAAALLFRRFDAFTNPQLYAEDSTIYLIQLEQFGIKSLFIPYGGYLHIVPRLITIFWGMLHVNLLYLPACYSFSEFVITFLIVLNLWKTSAYLNIRYRLLYSTAFLFLPVAADIFMNLTNLNWIISLYLINFLFVRYNDYTPKYYYPNLLALFLISLSGPFSTLLLPVLALIFIFEGKELTSKKILLLAIILLGGIVQFIYIKFIDTEYRRVLPYPPEPSHFFRLFTNNMEQVLFMKYNFMKWMPEALMMVISFVAFLMLAIFFIIRYAKLENKRKYLLLLYPLIVLVTFIHAFWPNESQIMALDNARYYFIPFTCFAWILILSFDKKIKPVFIIIYLGFFLLQYRYTQMILPDKQWKKEITEYYNGKRDTIDVNPKGWQIVLPEKK